MVSKPALIALLFSIASAHAADGEVRPVFGAHPGYLFNVVDEKTKRDVEMVMLEKPKEEKAPTKRVIFDEKLTKEFQAQYQYRFGQTSAEQTINNPGRDSEYTFYNRQSIGVLDYQDQQHKFGDYMMRRLTEYHFDNWAKNDPDFKPVYQMKDKLSNLDVKVKDGYKLKWKYNLSGPSMEANLENPYKVETRVQAMMNGVLSSPKELIYSLGYNLTTRVKVEALYREYQQLMQLVLSRRVTKHISVSLTGSSGQLPSDATIHQDLILVGFGYSE